MSIVENEGHNKSIQREALFEIANMTESMIDFNETYRRINALAKRSIGETEGLMRYFEILVPNKVHALVKANSQEQAQGIYAYKTDHPYYQVAFEINEIDSEQALLLYGSLMARNVFLKRCPFIPYTEMLKKFRDNHIGLLVMSFKI